MAAAGAARAERTARPGGAVRRALPAPPAGGARAGRGRGGAAVGGARAAAARQGAGAARHAGAGARCGTGRAARFFRERDVTGERPRGAGRGRGFI